jgi:hypothetical protein
MPICENASLNPINPYGFTKLACERMMNDFGRGYGLKSVRLPATSMLEVQTQRVRLASIMSLRSISSH